MIDGTIWPDLFTAVLIKLPWLTHRVLRAQNPALQSVYLAGYGSMVPFVHTLSPAYAAITGSGRLAGYTPCPSACAADAPKKNESEGVRTAIYCSEVVPFAIRARARLMIVDINMSVGFSPIKQTRVETSKVTLEYPVNSFRSRHLNVASHFTYHFL